MEKVVRSKAKDAKLLRIPTKRATRSMRKRWKFEVLGDSVMLQVLHLGWGHWNFLKELSDFTLTFHVSNMKKCYTDEPLVMPLEGIHVDDKLQFVEEPVEIMEREIKRLKRSGYHWSRFAITLGGGPEFIGNMKII
ncbi:hypothetical protein Tco_0939781 [Tanacetum coccineum]|uniref:Reverse transcriptase domain-containing protein n=1 Tax=Tanacetum coccineum TaxID=301880 RepID=A0ABQ5DNQ6_9ASTR